MKVGLKLLTPQAKVPTYATDGSGAFDIYSTTEGVILPNSNNVFGTGCVFQIPKGYVMLIFSRSGHGFGHDIRLGNCVGVIDSDYRGEVKVKLTSDSNFKAMKVHKGDRIAQGIILPYEIVEFEELPYVDETERGEGGFGSTGN